MTVDSRQLKEVERRVEFTCITNMQQPTYNGGRVINGSGAIALAFVLGTRFGMAYPYLAGDYMDTFIRERGESGVPLGEVALRHERAMQACVYTVTNPRDTNTNTEE